MGQSAGAHDGAHFGDSLKIAAPRRAEGNSRGHPVRRSDRRFEDLRDNTFELLGRPKLPPADHPFDTERVPISTCGLGRFTQLYESHHIHGMAPLLMLACIIGRSSVRL
jgi:hypothetical protein